VRELLVQCAACGRQTSVTAGTIFQDTRTPLTVWFRAMCCVTSQKTGTSARTLHRVLGLGSYQTAWAWLHKLRPAMVRPGRERLTGRIEVDESYVGALEQGGEGAARSRKRDGSADTLQAFIDDTIEPGSAVHTDAWLGYERLKAHGYRHRITFLADHPEPATELLLRVHLVASLLKRWLLGTHQGAVSPAHLDYYLDEFTFRFNRRRARHPGKLFYRLVQQAVAVEPAPYRELVKGVHPRKPRRRRRSRNHN
jgi:transposase-like protein